MNVQLLAPETPTSTDLFKITVIYERLPGFGAPGTHAEFTIDNELDLSSVTQGCARVAAMGLWIPDEGGKGGTYIAPRMIMGCRVKYVRTQTDRPLFLPPGN